MTAGLAEPAPPSVATLDLAAVPDVRRRTSAGRLPGRRRGRASEHIRAGDAFQVVLSQRFEVDTDADALDVYRVLRASNPSPYMYLLRFAGHEHPFDVVGLLAGGAGDRDRGDDAVRPPARRHAAARGDARARTPRSPRSCWPTPRSGPSTSCSSTSARNDLGRVCAPGTVDVSDFMRVERYSHVMHLVSTVDRAGPARGRTAFDVLRATFPAGTVSGAPKPRAMEIIEELEPHRRNLYAGTVGYLDAGGDMDMAIAIRTAVLHRGRRRYVQAGAGLVADSDPVAEQAECENKAAAVLRAIAAAATLRPA